MALISDLPNATPQKSDLMEIQNGQTSSNNSSVGQLMQLSASENLAPAYDANAGVYAVGDFVSYDGTLYQCNTAIATPEVFDATKWDAVKVTEISSGASVIQLTQAEYTALSTAEKMNGSIYKLTDKAIFYCLDEEYHAVKELTTAQYEALTTAEKNNGTIYIQTDAETTGEDIPVSSGETETIAEAINELKEGGGTSAIDDGIISPHKTWSSNKINAILNAHIYGFNINFNTKEVTYIADAVGMTPAYMDYANDTFVYGSWRNAFFMPRPCMLKRNGEVDFYLDPNNYEYQEDGVTPSHINHLGNVETSSTSANTYVADDYLVYDGVLYQVTDAIAVGDTIEEGVNVTEVTGAPDVKDNAMIEWGRDNRLIWYKQVNELDGTVSVYIADYQVDQDYHAWSFYDAEGNLKEHFYTPIFNGSLINTVLRSIGGVDYTKLCQSKTGAQEVTAAEKNNIGTNKNWYTEVTSDMIIICHLLTLMGKSLNTSLTYGNGRSGQPSATSSMLGTGTMNNKGLFWGSNTGTYGVKVFGMENFWGNQYRRTAGLVLKDNKWYYKLTRSINDGSTAIDYNSDGTNYLTQNHTAPAPNYAQEMFYTSDGAFYTKATNATVGNTMYQDNFYANASGARYLFRGGVCYSAAGSCGAFSLSVDLAFSSASWALGTSLSYK